MLLDPPKVVIARLSERSHVRFIMPLCLARIKYDRQSRIGDIRQWYVIRAGPHAADQVVEHM